MKDVISIGLLSLGAICMLAGCSVPEPTQGQQVEAGFSLAGKSSDDLLQACQQEIKERIDRRADTYEFVTGSEVFDKDTKDGRYRVFYSFYADMTDPDDDIKDKTRFKGYCKFNDEGESVGSGLQSVVDYSHLE